MKTDSQTPKKNPLAAIADAMRLSFFTLAAGVLVVGALADAAHTLRGKKADILLDTKTGCEYISYQGSVVARSDDWGMQRGCRQLQGAMEVQHD